MPRCSASSVGSDSLAGLQIDTLSLLRDPYAFTQTSLLSPWEFVQEASKRTRFPLFEEQLEVLHRRRLVQPFYEVHDRQVAAPVSYPEADVDSWTPLTTIREAHRDGRLSDPSRRRWSPWQRSSRKREFFYSHYQLLAFDGVERFFSGSVCDEPPLTVSWELEGVDRAQRVLFREMRGLAYVLEALSGTHRGHAIGIDQLVRPFGADGSWSPNDYRQHVEAGAVPLLDALDIDDDQLVATAESLLAQADVIDPLGTWHRVVRIADPTTWGDLRYDALIANDCRVAAEVLAQFIESRLPGTAERSPLAPIPGALTVNDGRLRVSPAERQHAMRTFGLSDRPALVVAVEGDTEQLIVPRALDLLVPDPGHLRIEVVNLDGIKADVRLLARAVAAPEINPDAPRYAHITTPLTTLLVVVDPEAGFGSDEGRQAKRDSMIDTLWSALPPVLQSPQVRDLLARILIVRTWPCEFEFAHWSDDELAGALQQVSPSFANMPLQLLRDHLASCRRDGRPIQTVLGKGRSSPSKVALAEALWPRLEQRITAESWNSDMPVVQHIHDALAVAAEMVTISAVERQESR